MNVGWRGIGKATRAGLKASSAATQGTVRLVEAFVDGRHVRRGVLGPSARPIPPDQVHDFLDYRGVATPSEVGPQKMNGYPLGRHIDVDRWRPGKQNGGSPITFQANEVDRNTVVFAPIGSGKTESLIVPWVYAALQEGRSVIAIDSKGDFFTRFQNYARQKGPAIGVPVRAADLTGALNGSWDLRMQCQSTDQIDPIVSAIVGSEPKGNSDPAFYYRDRQLTESVLRLAADLGGRVTFGLVSSLLDSTRLCSVLHRCSDLPTKRFLEGLLTLDPSDYQKVTWPVAAYLKPLASGPVERILSGSNKSIDLEHSLAHPGLLLCVAPLHLEETSRAFVSMFVGVCFQKLYQRLAQPQNNRVLIAIDELAQLSGKVNLTRPYATIRSGGSGIIAGLQSPSQLSDSECSVILENSLTQVFIKGIGPAVATMVSKGLGSRPVQALTGERKAGFARSVATVPVLGEREIQGLPFSAYSAIVVTRLPSRTSKPILTDLRRDDL